MQMQPLTAKEQYWATRALRAEALLTAQEHHKKEVKNLEHVQEMRLQRELAMISKEYKEKQTMLEKLLAVLAAVVAILILVIIYLTIHYARHSTQIQHKQQERWWAAIGASHFTIPILSPFTSVVEHDTSAIGSKVIATIATVTACLVYFIFRHWLSSKQTNKPVSSAPRMISAATQMLPSIDR
ncbi:hypothetical protein CPC08DRAFT_645800 [Agrocybe pediades]|nr:hypothetical protein CPC08DRAFT_645800 [Agrocybe pediades]